MPGSRKPGYPAADRSKVGSGVSVPSNGGQAGRGAPESVISASRSAQLSPETARGTSAGPRGSRDSVRIPAGNVVAFPQPKRKRVRRNILISLTLVVLLCGGAVAAAFYSPLMALKTVRVTGTSLLTPEQVQDALGPLNGTPLPQIGNDQVQELLSPLVQVKAVTSHAEPPGELVVNIQERIPVAIIKQGEQFTLVDVEGVSLGSTADPASVALPLIDGGAGTIGQDLFQATAAVLDALPADILARLSNASAQSVDAVELKLVDGQTVVWGNAGDRELKAKVLEALLKVPMDPKNPIKVYDVSVPRNPVTR